MEGEKSYFLNHLGNHNLKIQDSKGSSPKASKLLKDLKKNRNTVLVDIECHS